MNKLTSNTSPGSVILAVLFLFVLSASSLFAVNPVLETVGADDFFSVMEDKRDEGKGILIDVRTPAEYVEGHAPTSLNIDFYEQDFQNMIEKLDKDETYFLYCRSGNRSGRTLNLMKSLGFKEVYDLSGGWSRNASRLLSVKAQ